MYDVNCVEKLFKNIISYTQSNYSCIYSAIQEKDTARIQWFMAGIQL
jgi:hypothetical protein